MAGDWIKMREDLFEDPSVLWIAQELNTRSEHVVGYCHRFWGWVSRQTEDGQINGVTLESCGSLLMLPGFPEMLVKVGWLEYDSEHVVIRIPKFERHLSGSAKARVRATERQRKSRVTKKCDTNVTGVTKKEYISRTLKAEVLARDSRTCMYCGWKDGDTAPVGPYIGARITVDHLVPESLGGPTNLENLVACCSVCNSVKGQRTLKELGWNLVTKNCDISATREEKRREDLPVVRSSEKVTFSQNGKNKQSSDVELVIGFYCEKHPRSRPGAQERKKIKACLSGGYSVEDLKDAIRGCHISPYHCGENEHGRKYQTLELIVRDSKHVDQFIEIWEKHTATSADDATDERLHSQASWATHEAKEAVHRYLTARDASNENGDKRTVETAELRSAAVTAILRAKQTADAAGVEEDIQLKEIRLKLDKAGK